MYIFKNALRCIVRAKGRNILIGIIVLLLSISSCIGLSIKESNEILKDKYSSDMEISATVTLAERKWGNSTISKEKYEEFAKLKSVKSFSQTSSLYFSAGENIEPLDVSGSFSKNKDFIEKYGNIKNGETKTTTSESSDTTSSATDKKSSVKGQSANMSQPSLLFMSNTESSDASTEDEQEETPPEPPEDMPEPPEGIPEDMPEPPEEIIEDETTEQETETKKSSNEKSNNFGKKFGFSQNSNGNSKTDWKKFYDNKYKNFYKNRSSNNIGNGKTIINNQTFFNMASMNDFTLIGANNADALPDYVKKLNAFSDFGDSSLNCVISKNLADENSLKKGGTFTLKNPKNEDETYKFKIVGICDTSSETDSDNTSSNASFTDNCIYVTSAAADKIIENSATTNKKSEKNKLSAVFSGTFKFKNLNDYNAFGNAIGDEYTTVSEDVENYETSLNQLETLGKYATYFLVVIFIIGAFVLIIINLFSIRDRKYEIGVLTAIGMKKGKVALQFISELFVVTFIALIIGSGIGAASSVPVTNTLLKTVNTVQQTSDETSSDAQNERRFVMPQKEKNTFIASVDSATDMKVILEMIAVGLVLTLISAFSAITFIMRYEPLKILSNRD